MGPERELAEQPPAPDDPPVAGDPELIDAITAHIEKHLGPVEQVFHEIVSPTVHVDLWHRYLEAVE